MVEFAKVEAIPLSTKIANALRDSLIGGAFSKGEEISLTDIAEQFGVSRTPVREAFQILAKDGFIELRMNRSAIVIGVDEHFLTDYYEIRSVLEARAASNVAARCEDVSELERIQADGRERFPMSVEEYREYNKLFHKTLWRLSDNERLVQMLSGLWMGVVSGKYMDEYERQKKGLASHELILEDIRNHDTEKAFNDMKNHIEGSMGNIINNIKQTKRKLHEIIN